MRDNPNCIFRVIHKYPFGDWCIVHEMYRAGHETLEKRCPTHYIVNCWNCRKVPRLLIGATEEELVKELETRFGWNIHREIKVITEITSATPPER